MENLEKQVNESLTQTQDFKGLKDELLKKLAQEPSEEAIVHYKERFGVDLNEAKRRIEENYRREIESVDHKEIALRLSNAMKIISPKLMGLEFREKDREILSQRAISLAESASQKVNEIENKVMAVAAHAIVDKLNELDLNRLVLNMVELERQNKELRDRIVELELDNQLKFSTKKTLWERLFG